jgi:hypothetical protein
MAQPQVESAAVEESPGVLGRLFGNLLTGVRPVDSSKVAQLLTPPTTPKSITIALPDSSSPLTTASSSILSRSRTFLTSTCRRRVGRRAAPPHQRTRRTQRLALHTSSGRVLFTGRTRLCPLVGVSFELSHCCLVTSHCAIPTFSHTLGIFIPKQLESDLTLSRYNKPI